MSVRAKGCSWFLASVFAFSVGGTLAAEPLDGDARRRILTADELSVTDEQGSTVVSGTDVSWLGGVLTTFDWWMRDGFLRAGSLALTPTGDFVFAFTNAPLWMTSGALSVDGTAAKVTVSLKDSRLVLAGGAYDGMLIEGRGAVDFRATNCDINDNAARIGILDYAAGPQQTGWAIGTPAGVTSSYVFDDSVVRLHDWSNVISGAGETDISVLNGSRLFYGDYSVKDSGGNWHFVTYQFGMAANAKVNLSVSGAGSSVENGDSHNANFGMAALELGQDSPTAASAGAVLMSVTDGGVFKTWDLKSYSINNVFAVTNGALSVDDALLAYRGRFLLGEKGVVSAQYSRLGVTGDTFVDMRGGAWLSPGFNFLMPMKTNGKGLNTKVTFGLDGGHVLAPKFGGQATTGGYAHLSADGGSVHALLAGGEFLYGFDEAKLGPKGLTVGSDGNDVTIRQDFAAKDGEVGRLVLAGAGTKTLVAGATGVNGESFLDLTGGTTVLASGTHEQAVLSVSDNACFSLAGAATAATIAGLALGTDETAGVLAFDAGDLLTVEGEAAVAKAAIQPTFALAAGTTYPVFRAKTVASGAAEAWADAKVVSGGSPNFAYAFTTSEADGYTVFAVTATDTGSAAAQSVAWTDNADLDAETVTLASGTKTVTEYVSAAATTTFDVAKDAEVGVTGRAAVRKLVKRGGGRVRFDGAATTVSDGIRIEDGLLAIRNFPDAGFLGGYTKLEMVSGTLELSNDRPGAFFPYAIHPVPPAISGVVTLKNDTDISTWVPHTYADYANRGCFLKRGAGTLTLYPELYGRSYSVAANNLVGTMATAPSLTDPQVFGANGEPPTWYSGFTIAEGGCVLTGGKTFFVNSLAGLIVGIPLKNAAAQPGFVLDGVTYAHRPKADNAGLAFGNYLTEANSDASCWSPYMILTNGATYCNYLGQFVPCTGSTAPVTPKFDVCNSDLDVQGSLGFNNAVSAGSLATWSFRDHSRLRCSSTLFVNSSADVTLDNSVLCSAEKNTADYPPHGNGNFASDRERMVTGIYRYVNVPTARFDLTVKNGARLNLRGVSCGSADMVNPIVFAFDGGTWVLDPVAWTGYDDKQETSHEFYVSAGKFGLFEAHTDGKGLTLEINEPEFRFSAPIIGAGDVIKTGAGTLAFGREKRKYGASAFYTQNVPSWRTTGALVIREGGVALDDEWGYTNAVVDVKMVDGTFLDLGGRTFGGAVFGGGALTNGVMTNAVFEIASTQTDGPTALVLEDGFTAENPTFKIQIDSDWQARGLIAFEGGELSGTVTLDLGRSSSDPFSDKAPEDIVIGTYSGAAPNLRGWVQVGTGTGRRRLGKLYAKDGKVCIDGRLAGMMLLVR